MTNNPVSRQRHVRLLVGRPAIPTSHDLLELRIEQRIFTMVEPSATLAGNSLGVTHGMIAR